MGGRELALGERRVGPIHEPEQYHRGEAHEVDMGMHRRELEMLAHAHPDAEGEAKNAEQQSDQDEPAVDVFHDEFLPQIAPRPVGRGARPLAKCRSGRHKRARANEPYRQGTPVCAFTTIATPISISSRARRSPLLAMAARVMRTR